jgi:hypothetical protein
MTDFNIYCDESRHTSDPSQPYMVIGAIKCPREEKISLVSRIHHLQAKHNAQGEIGWKRVSPNRINFYHELIDLFANSQNVTFRCLVADRRNLDHEKFNDGDAELGFYKLYYQMLVHWLESGHNYHIYLDWQQNKAQHRFHELNAVLKNKLSGTSRIACLEPVTSSTLPLLGLADVMIGAVGYAWNNLSTSEAKVGIGSHIAKAGGLPSLAKGTSKSEKKLNIFYFDGGGRG